MKVEDKSDQLCELEKLIERNYPGRVSQLVTGKCLVGFHINALNDSPYAQSVARALLRVAVAYQNTVVYGDFQHAMAFVKNQEPDLKSK